ncbi:MAG: TonB-dependent receptor [Gammaproteobacteria bacterium]|nr:TonB-dependent receptor [Gammaproteobacteria bacterium]
MEETLYVGSFALSGGVKKFHINVSREDQFGVDRALDVDSDSGLLFSGGVTWETPVQGLDVFAGYAQNFKAISSTLLEVPGRSLDLLEPETASNVDVGVQYAGERLAFSAAWYSIDFQNRIFYLGPQTPAGPNYLVPGGGAYFNAGGIETSGVEVAATVPLSERTSFYTALTFNNSDYLGTGDPLVDENQGIVAGTDVTGVPSRLWVISLDRSGPLGGGMSAKYTSSRRVSLTADWHTDAYWIVDAYVTLRGEALSDLLRSTEFSLVANNLGDAAYLSAITENAAWLGAPRTVSMSATVSF